MNGRRSPHGPVLAFGLAAIDAADQRRAHAARVYAKPRLDEGDDDYDFVEASLERWGDRSSPRDPNWRRS